MQAPSTVSSLSGWEQSVQHFFGNGIDAVRDVVVILGLEVFITAGDHAERIGILLEVDDVGDDDALADVMLYDGHANTIVTVPFSHVTAAWVPPSVMLVPYR